MLGQHVSISIIDNTNVSIINEICKFLCKIILKLFSLFSCIYGIEYLSLFHKSIKYKTMGTFKAISKVVAVELINKSRGRIFSVTFKKKDNTIRVMNCRLEVKKHLKGGDLAYDPSLKGLKSVYDMQSKAYRMINLETIKRLSINGEHYIVEPF